MTTEENNSGKHTNESSLLKTILSEYKAVLHNREIQEKNFEDGIKWFYEKLLELPAPQVIYSNSLDFAKKIKNQPRKINRLSIESIVERFLNNYENKNDMRTDRVLLKSMLLENLHMRHYRAVQKLIYEYYKNGINLKNNLTHVAYIDFHMQLKGFKTPDFLHFKELFCSGAYHIFFWEKQVVALTAPTIRFDEFNLLHSSVYPAIEWPGSAKAYYIHYREMPNWIFSLYGTEELYHNFLEEENEDIRAGIITLIKEREGDQGLISFLKAELIDEKEVVHFSGYREVLRLYKSKEKFDYLYNRHGRPNQPYCWSEFTCPSTGTTYLIDNSADFTDAVKAAKFLRPSIIPQKLTYRWSHDAS